MQYFKRTNVYIYTFKLGFKWRFRLKIRSVEIRINLLYRHFNVLRRPRGVFGPHKPIAPTPNSQTNDRVRTCESEREKARAGEKAGEREKERERERQRERERER